MKIPNVLFILIIILAVATVYLFAQTKNKTVDTSPATVSDAINARQKGDCVPTFADGGGPYYLPNSHFRENIAPEDSEGDKLIVEGYVYKAGCEEVVAGAVVDIWQADETGEYQNDWYRGQVITAEDGSYRFQTVVPRGYGSGTGFRPPHIHFKVFVNEVEIITSQMFFPESAGAPGFEDAYIMEVTETEGKLLGTHDVILPEY